jgi:pilus assembly protein CpaC
MQSGGEFPILVPQSLGTVSVQYRQFGTQVDFVPIVLGDGMIHLEVRPRVSEIDDSRSVIINGTSVPGLRVRQVDTAVEMRPGQTLAIAGLVQWRSDAVARGIPGLMNLPVIGAPFRRVSNQINEVELLILVTPQLVEAMDPCDVPAGGPGLNSRNPSDCELYSGGHIEVPLGGDCPGGHHFEAMNPDFGTYEGGAPILETPAQPVQPADAAVGPPQARHQKGRRVKAASKSKQQDYIEAKTATVRAAPISVSVNRAQPNKRSNRTKAAPEKSMRRKKTRPTFVGPTGYDVIK